MADRQIRELKPQEMPLAQRVRPRSLLSQISAALLQPVYFFRTLPTMGETRQWLWVGLLILLLIGFSAVRQEALTETNATGGLTPGFGGDFGAPVDGGDFGGSPLDGGGGIGIDPGRIPSVDSGGVPVDGGSTGATSSITDTLTTGIVAASGIFVGWLILMVLLSEVSLLRGRAPRFGQNFQIAIWSSLPLALMALLQILYYAAGGTVGKPGVSGLLDQWSDYASQPPFVQALLLSLASSITIFFLWKLMLLYFGARFALNGRRWSALLVVILWVVVSVVTPVVTGAVEVPEPADITEPLPGAEGEPPFEEPSIEGDSGFDPFNPGGEGNESFSDERTGEAPVDEFSTDGNPGMLITEEPEISSTQEVEITEP
jgi:hypothetical protein